MTGAELAAIRKAAGLSQIALAKRAGIGRHAVSYWECKADIPHRWRWPWAVEQIGKVITLPVYSTPNAPARGWSVSPFAALDAMMERQLAAAKARAAEREAKRRVVCGAKTRKGTACRNLSEPGKRRCKFHGGKSTGARTPEGIERIREAQRRRWEKTRCSELPPRSLDGASNRQTAVEAELAPTSAENSCWAASKLSAFASISNPESGRETDAVQMK